MNLRKTFGPIAFGISAILALAACGGTAVEGEDDPTASCGEVSTVALDDDTWRVAMHALDNDLIESETIDHVEVAYLQIPAAQQAVSSGQYTFPTISLSGLTLARANGLDLRPVSFAIAHTGGGQAIYVRADSDIESPSDLTGKRVAVPSFGATIVPQAQIVLSEKYGLDVRLDGGDIIWVELDPPTQFNALAQGDIDAVIMWVLPGWTASNNPELKNIAQLDLDYNELLGAWPVGAVLTATGEYADSNPHCVEEFQRMVAASVDYAKENYEELAADVSEITGAPIDYVKFWWGPDHPYEFGGVVDDQWLDWVDAFNTKAADLGLLPTYEDIRDIAVMPTEAG